jgi:UDP-glucose 4-epimerase
MRVVVIGATGNVGVALMRELAEVQHVTELVGVARRRPALTLPGVTWEAADILTADLDALLAGADAVVHLAWAIQPARDRALTRATNVDASARVFRAAGRAGVARLVYASSVGTYSPGPRDRRVDEHWPRAGVASSFYSVDKAAAERELDAVEAEFPALRVVRLRPGIVMQRGAAEEIRRFFLGPLIPNRLIRPGLVPLMPDVRSVAFQAVHAEDLARAYARAVLAPDAHGAYNIAAEPPLTTRSIARRLRAVPVPVPTGVARAAAALTWRLRLQPTPPGWLDLGVHAPLMDTRRARDELGWTPTRTAVEALDDLLGGLRDGAGDETPPLAGGADAPGRGQEIATGLGARSGVRSARR